MMANLKQALSLLTNANALSESVKQAVKIREKFFIFPFVANSGVVDKTQAGYTEIGSRPQDFTSFVRMISGQAAFTVEWENSTTRYWPDGIPQDDITAPQMQCDFKVGKYLKGDVVLDESGVGINEVPIGDYAGESIVRTIRVNLNTQFTQQDKLKLYLIPSFLPEIPDPIEGRPAGMRVVKCSQWLIVQDYINYYDPNNKRFLYCEITFASLGDLFAASGQSVWQMVQMNGGIGGGFAFPLVIQKSDTTGNNYTDYEVQIDENCLNPVGVKYLQIECQGNAPLSTFYAMGRPNGKLVKNDDGTYSTKLYAPRHLLGSTFEAPLQDPVSTYSNPATTYVLYMNAAPTITSGFEDWKDKVASQYDLFKTKDFQGNIFTTGSSFTNIMNTNPKSNSVNADYTNMIYWDKSWVFGSNGIGDIVGTYNLSNGYSLRPYGTGSGFVGNAQGFNLAKMTNKSAVNILAANAFIFNQYQILPMEAKEFTTVKIPLPTGILNYIPIVGGWLNSFFNGVSVGFNVVKNTTEWPNFTGINFFIAREYLDFQVNSVYSAAASSMKANQSYDEKVRSIASNLSPLSLDALRGSDDMSSVGAISGANMTETAFMIKLTDKVSLIPYTFDNVGKVYTKQTTSYIISTALIGQYVGTWQDVVGQGHIEATGRAWLFDQEFTVQDSESAVTMKDNKGLYPDDSDTLLSYSIDMVCFQNLFVGNVIITAFWDDPSRLGREQAMIYQAVIKSQASYKNGNLRDWFTKYKTSYIAANNGQLPSNTFPKTIPQPVPFDVHTLKYSLTGVFSIGGNAMYDRNQNLFLGGDGIFRNGKLDDASKGIILPGAKDSNDKTIPNRTASIPWKQENIETWDKFVTAYGTMTIAFNRQSSKMQFDINEFNGGSKELHRTSILSGTNSGAYTIDISKITDQPQTISMLTLGYPEVRAAEGDYGTLPPDVNTYSIYYTYRDDDLGQVAFYLRNKSHIVPSIQIWRNDDEILIKHIYEMQPFPVGDWTDNSLMANFMADRVSVNADFEINSTYTDEIKILPRTSS